jgi:hypothetical protein
MSRTVDMRSDGTAEGSGEAVQCAIAGVTVEPAVSRKPFDLWTLKRVCELSFGERYTVCVSPVPGSNCSHSPPPVTDYLCHRLDAPPASHGQHCAKGRTPAS